ncbi:MAG TPA: IS21 family transposase [Ktedonobacteraceae bacterium]|nr:IS21 family transposase [Ktedonobacteraceae bacterium]
MLNEGERERIRRAYYLEKKSIRRIAQEEGYSRDTVERAITDAPRSAYRLSRPRLAPRLGPYHTQIAALLEQNKRFPPKQRYTTHKIFEILQAEGYQGSEARVRQYLSERKKANQPPEIFLPLEFEPGQDAQVDWGEAVAIIGSRRQKVQFFLMRLCYSRRAFAMAFPSQAQECFLSGHLQAFKHFGGIPHRISYDNLGTAVKIIFDPTSKRRRSRREIRGFVSFRSHYLFESHFCTPGLEGAHEKGGIESGIGYTRRQFMVPIPEATSYADLNRQLLERCLKEDSRRVARETQTIGEAWEQEREHFLPLPPSDYECCDMTTVHLTPYSQATYDTNRYSVPANRARREVTLKAYPFQVEIWDGTELLASHPRCYDREQDIFDPQHYLPLLQSRPGAFDYAKPIKRWRADWPPSYDLMLRRLRETWPDGRGIQEFIRVLRLHQEYPAPLLEQAIEQALTYGCVHLDGVLYCLRQLSETVDRPPVEQAESLDEKRNQSVDLSRYEQLLKLSW